MSCMVEVYTSTEGTLWKRQVVYCACWTNLSCLPQKSHHFPLKQGQWTLSQIPQAVCCSLNLCWYSLYRVWTANKSFFWVLQHPPPAASGQPPSYLGLWSQLSLVFCIQSPDAPGVCHMLSILQCTHHPVHKTHTSWEDCCDLLSFLSHSHNRLLMTLLWLALCLSFHLDGSFSFVCWIPF